MPVKGRGRGRGRKTSKGKKGASPSKLSRYPSQIASDEDNEDEIQFTEEHPSTVRDSTERCEVAAIDIEEDISKLEAPTFTTIDRGPPEPLHQNTKLRWDYKVNLIGEKVLHPLLHCCEKCKRPILIYGRMIPCKHVFCLDCAKAADNLCPRCQDKVSRVERSALGTVYMCMNDGSRYGYDGCRRTYLSQRDLQAHIGHRHMKSSASSSSSRKSSPKYDHSGIASSKSPGSVSVSPRDPRHQTISQSTKSMQQLLDKHHIQSSSNPSLKSGTTLSGPGAQQPAGQTYTTPIPVMSTRTNLITIPIQDHSNQSSVQPVGISSTEYVSYSATPVTTVPRASSGVASSNYQVQVNSPYVRPPIQHAPALVSYPTIPPSTYAPSISSSEALSFSQAPPTHPSHMPPPPPMRNPSVPSQPAQQIYTGPPPVQRPRLDVPPSRPVVPVSPQRYPGAPFEEARASSPSYQWQGAGPPPRGVPRPSQRPSQTSSYRPQYYH